MQRVERFATSVTHTMADGVKDVLPIVSATSDELLREMKSDVPKVTEEFRNEVNRTFSFLRPRAETAR